MGQTTVKQRIAAARGQSGEAQRVALRIGGALSDRARLPVEAEAEALKIEEERKKKLAIQAQKKAQEDLKKAQKARRDAKYAARKKRR